MSQSNCAKQQSDSHNTSLNMSPRYLPFSSTQWYSSCEAPGEVAPRLNLLQRASVWGPVSHFREAYKMLSFARWVSHEWVSFEPFAYGIRVRTFCLSATPIQEKPKCRLPWKVLRLTLSLFCKTLLLRNSATHSGVHWCHHAMKRLSRGWACLLWSYVRCHSSVDRTGVWVKLSFLPWRYRRIHWICYFLHSQKYPQRLKYCFFFHMFFLAVF